MNSILDEKTTSEDDGEKEKKMKLKNIKNENTIKSRLRKNPKKAQMLYSITDLNEHENTNKLQDLDFQNLKNILEIIKNNPKSIYFRQSAIRMLYTKRDKEYYKSLIPHPQDLGNITKKLNHKKYKSYQEFYDDLNLIWDNAQSFNEDSSEVYKDAEYMRDFIDDLFKEKKIYDKVEHEDSINEENIENNEKKNDALIGQKRKKSIYEENEKIKEPTLDIEIKNNINDKKLENFDNNINNINNNNKVSYITSSNIFKKCYNNKYLNDNNLNNELKNFNNSFNDLKNFKELNKNLNNEENSKNIKNNIVKNDDISFYDKDNKKINCLNEKLKLSEIDKLNDNDKYINEVYNKFINSNNYQNNKSINKIKNEEEKINYYNYINDKDYNYNNNLLSQVGYDSQLIKEENIEKREEEIKMKIKNEISYIYTNKIGKCLDKLTDDEMFDLIEFIDNIRPQAIIEVNDNVNIDMTKFSEDTFIQVYNFIKHLKINKNLK